MIIILFFSLFNSTYHCIQFTLHLADASANFNHYKGYSFVMQMFENFLYKVFCTGKVLNPV